MQYFAFADDSLGAFATESSE